MENFMQQIANQMGSYMPRVLGALAVLIIGWIVALIISALIRKSLQRTTLDNRLAAWFKEEPGARPTGIERTVSKGVFYLLMLFVLVAAFQALGITLITEPINNLLNRLFQFGPQLLGAVLLALLAWICAKLLRMFVLRALVAAKADERLGGKAELEGKEKLPLTKTISEAVYWLILLLFLPAILSTLQLGGLLMPVEGMMNKILVFLPNVITAALILFVGWFVARIVMRVVTSLLQTVGTDRLSERAGLAKVLGENKLSKIIGMIVYILILVPIVISALNTLRLDAVTAPASRMLDEILLAVPNIFTAMLILAIGYLLGRILAGFVSNLLAGIGFNALPAKLGVKGEVSDTRRLPSSVAGYLTLAAVMIFAFIEAANQLGFRVLSDLVSRFLLLSGHIILGLIIFAIGLFLANLVSRVVLSTASANAKLLAGAARVAILVFAGAMALREMGLANEIVNLAFGLILGAIAVAVAISLGLGGREIAARELEEWVKSIKSRRST